MRIVKLNENYLEEILKINGHINKKGIGLALNIKDNFIFIPITSQIKYDSEKLKHLDYPLFNVNDGKIMPLRRCKSATPSCHCDGVKVPLKNPKVIKNFGIYTILFFS